MKDSETSTSQIIVSKQQLSPFLNTVSLSRPKEYRNMNTKKTVNGVHRGKPLHSKNETSESTLNELCRRHNALARYVGVPFVIEPKKITRYPAVLEEHGAICSGFGGYRIQLSPFRGGFCSVRFRGMGNGNDVVCGYVIDKDGYIESFARMPCSSDGWTELPLTSKSHALFASVPLRHGKPVWKNIAVELLCDSMRTGIENVVTKLSDRITALEQAAFCGNRPQSQC